PELPAHQSFFADSAAQNSDWYPGKNIRAAIDRYQQFRERGGMPSVRKAALAPARTANALIGRFLSRINARRTAADPGSPYSPDKTLVNEPAPDNRIPDRYGRAVFAPDIAHPPYCRGSGSTVLRRNVLCLGVGEYKVHRIWIGGVLAWINGASTGAVAGLVIYQLIPGEQMALDYVSLDSGPPLDGNWTELANQGGYDVDASDYSVTWLPDSGSSETPQVPQIGRFFHRNSTSLELPVGVVLSEAGTRTKILGKIPAAGSSYNFIHVANTKPNYTRVKFDRVQISARQASVSGGSVRVFTGTVDGSPKISDLASTSGSLSGTDYNDVVITKSGDGLSFVLAAKESPSAPQFQYIADIAIRPTYRPPVGHLETSHLRVDYTASAENLALPIVVEATRIIDGIPDDGIGAAAYFVARNAFGASAVDQASFLAIPGSCGGADYSGLSPWEILRSLLDTA
ncbi:hypothetical protein, partial [Candidatus Macondimonas diazotrophica]|uniref:hypothetical protein n=1 Tax=Candidatus Macondimonas diazotrophica TaxID=2305248 RepID=UPI0014326CA9